MENVNLLQTVRARREQAIAQASNTLFDLAIIGGGIHGATLCRQAVHCGLSAVLLESQDYAAGISSKSSKLIHGGLRYLEQWNVGLVREALHQRLYQRAQAPHLTRPLPFLFPIIKGRTRPAWQIGVGLRMYDALAQWWTPDEAKPYAREFKHHQRVSEEEPVCSQLQALGLKYDDLFRYFDGQMDDTRIVIENVVDAAARGAVTLNKAKVTGLRQETLRPGQADAGDWKIRFFDSFSKTERETQAKFVVNLAGPWVPEVHALFAAWDQSWPTPLFSRGTHLFFRERVCDEGLILPSGEAGRVYFVLPYFSSAGDATLVGPTSVTVPANNDQPQSTPAEIEELLRYLHADFPAAGFSEKNLFHSIAGMRILAGPPAAARSQSSPPSSAVAVSRDEFVLRLPRYCALLGGKYTTAFQTAASILNQVVAELQGADAEQGIVDPVKELAITPLPGGDGWSETLREDLQRTVLDSIGVEFSQLSASSADHLGFHPADAFLQDEVSSLVSRFGSQAAAVIGEQFAPATARSAFELLLRRQVAYVLEVEQATEAADVLTRLGLDDVPQQHPAVALINSWFAPGVL